MNIGVIGKGFVGSAVEFGFSPSTGCEATVRSYDIDPRRASHTLEETVKESDYIFVSVPTPSNKDGTINLDMVEEAFESINDILKYIRNETDPVVLLRSTVVPGTTRKLQQKYPAVRIVFNPEFLTERNALLDFINQTRFVLGGRPEDTKRIAGLFRWRFGNTISIVETDYETAELIKYMTNCFFATKVSFLNEMRLIADKCNVDWDMAVEGFLRDGRIGHSHIRVPGPDGKFGFGGSCIPKDTLAMIRFGESLGLDMDVLNGIWENNLKVRPEKDWEHLRGRAIVDE